MLNCRVPQGFILGSLLFLTHVNELNLAMEYSEVYHFADDTILLNLNNCIKPINKKANDSLKTLENWLKSNKFSLRVGKTDLVFFTSSKKRLDLKIKLHEKRPYETDLVRYLGIQFD